MTTFVPGGPAGQGRVRRARRRRGSRWAARALRTTTALMLLLGGVVAGVVVSAAPAQACSCAMLGPQQRLDAADAVFIGDVVARKGKGVWEGPSGVFVGGTFTYTIAVDRVFKGDVAATQQVVASPDSPACGITLPDHGSVIIYGLAGGDISPGGVGKLAPDQYRTTLCSGSKKATQAPASYGQGWPPEGAAPAPGTPGSGADDGAAPASGSQLPVVVAVAAVLALAAGVGGALAVRRRRPVS